MHGSEYYGNAVLRMCRPEHRKACTGELHAYALPALQRASRMQGKAKKNPHSQVIVTQHSVVSPFGNGRHAHCMYECVYVGTH